MRESPNKDLNTKRREILKALYKAERAAKKLNDACADADSWVATYWNQEKGLCPPRWQSAELRRIAELAHMMAIHLMHRAEETKT